MLLKHVSADEYSIGPIDGKTLETKSLSVDKDPATSRKDGVIITFGYICSLHSGAKASHELGRRNQIAVLESKP